MVFVSLLGVIGLIFLAAFAARWLNKRFSFGNLNSSTKGIKIIECIGIAQDKQLMVVSVGSKYMLLGVTPGSVSKICDLDNDDISSFICPPNNNEPAFFNTFKKTFADTLRKNNSSEIADINVEKDGKNSENDF